MMTAFLGRREFITLVGGAAAWPIAARAQERVRRIGVLAFQAVDETSPVRQRGGRSRQGAQQGAQRSCLIRPQFEPSTCPGPEDAIAGVVNLFTER
jgi:hypothetical protein